jgi:hypothetical protein
MSESGSSLTTFFRIKNNEIYMVLFKSFAPYAPDVRLRRAGDSLLCLLIRLDGFSEGLRLLLELPEHHPLLLRHGVDGLLR